ncbi:MAG: DinB family protein [Planctomycetota bacterium]
MRFRPSDATKPQDLQTVMISVALKPASHRIRPPFETQRKPEMDLRAAMKSEFAHEAGLTRSVLDVVPDDLLGFQADESMHTIGWNVNHLVDIATWVDMILNQDSFDVAPPGAAPHSTPEMPTIAAALEAHDDHIATSLSVLDSFLMESLEDSWTLLAGGQPLLTHPKHMIYRMYVTNHIAHHRGHLLVYLRLNGVETPRLYG